MPGETFEHDLTGVVGAEKGEAASRVTAAEQLLAAIERGENPDGDLADLLRDAASHGGVEDRIVIDEVAGFGIVDGVVRGDEVPRLLGEQPVDELAPALGDIARERGEQAVEMVVESIERFEQAHGLQADLEIVEASKTNDPLWNKIAERTAEANAYTNKNAHIQRIPLSLPTRGQAEYDASAIQYASGAEMKDVLELYGVDPEVIEQASRNNWSVEVAELPPELQRALLTANIYEATTRSHDPEMKRQATERNSHVTAEEIWQPGTLHHVTKAKHLGAILQNGQLGVTLSDDREQLINNGGAQTWNVNFGQAFKEVAPDAGHEEKIRALSYNDRGDVYIHYARPEGCYREGEEYDGAALITLMSGGMPSTEISALTLSGMRHRQDELLATTRDAVVEAGFYIPILDLDGRIIYRKDEFDADIAAAEQGLYLTSEDRQRIAQEESYKKEQAQREQEAAAHGMSVEQYQEWQRTQPVEQPFI